MVLSKLTVRRSSSFRFNISPSKSKNSVIMSYYDALNLNVTYVTAENW